MASEFNVTARLNVELGNVTRATADLKRQFAGVNAPVTVNSAGAVAGLQKVSSGAQASAAALRQMQAQAASTAATLNATVTVTNAGAASLRNFSEQAGLAARRFAAFTAATGAIVAAVRGMQEGVRAAVEFQLSMNKVEQVSDEVSSKVGVLRTEIGNLATGLGVSSAALAETAITLKQAGLTVDQTRDALKALALTDLAPTFDSMKQSTEGLIAAFRQFNLSSTQFEQTLGAMNAVSGKFAVESSDIISAVQRAGGAFKLTAGDMKSGSEALNEFMALFTSVRATTRESADSIATGLRTVFTRFQRADTVKALGDLGINLRYTRQEAQALGQTNLTDQFVGAYEAVKRLSQGLEGLRETDPRYAQVVEQLGGYRQISRVVPLLKEFKTAEEAKNIAVAGGISLQLAAEKRQESLSNKVSKLKEEYLELFRKITESKSFTALANTMLTVASSFAKVLDFARPLLPLLTTLAAVKLGANLGTITGSFTRAFAAPPGALVSGPRAGGGVAKFATGGQVGGSGNTDTVPAVLTPGEFVVKKASAERIGYAKLHGLNERPERFLAGGRVATPTRRTPTPPRGQDALQGILNEFSQQTGISYRDLVSSVRVVSELPDGLSSRGRGVFRSGTRELLINRSQVKDLDLLRRTVFHELGHALDLQIGGGRTVASAQAGTAAARAGTLYSQELGRTARIRAGSPAYRARVTTAPEGFAEAVADAYAGAGSHGQTLLTDASRRSFERQIVSPARAQINYGFIDPTVAAKRRSASLASAPQAGLLGTLLSGARRLFGFSSGGSVPGAGNNDTEPALLMPGEFVLTKGAVAKLGVPALRDLNDGRSRVSLKRYAGGSTDPVGERERLLGLRGQAEAGIEVRRGLVSAGSYTGESLENLKAELLTFEKVLAGVNHRISRLDAAPTTPPAAEAGRGQALLARLKGRQPQAPRPSEDVHQALSFGGDAPAPVKALPSEPDVPFVSHAAQVRKDSEDQAEKAREQRERQFHERAAEYERLKAERAGAVTPAGPTSYVSQLKSPQQFAFFQQHALGQDGGPGFAQAVAESHARRLGDLGRAGIASGAVEDAASEAVAQLAVAPPEGFNPNHKNAKAFVATHVQQKVRERLRAEYGEGYKSFGGYVPVGADGNAVEVAGREADPSAPVDHAAELARTQAHEAEKARRLEQVRAVLPTNALTGERDDRFNTLRTLGASYKDASHGAADVRYTETLAGHVADKLGVTPPGGPPNDGNFVGAAPGGPSGGAGKRVRDGIHTVPLNKVEEFAKSLGLGRADEVAVRSQILAAANQTDKAGHLTAGLSDAALEVKGGRFARVAGVVNNASAYNPLGAQVDKFVREGEKALPPAEPAPRRSTLTSAEELYQAKQLVAAQQKYGERFGVAEDEVRANGQLGRGQARGDIQAFDFEQRRRAASGAFVDPLVAARDSRRQRLDEQKAQQRAVAERANGSGRGRPGVDTGFTNALVSGGTGLVTVSNIAGRTTTQTTVGDRIADRAARDAAGVGGVTDPTLIKNEAVRKFRSGEAGVLGDNGRGVLESVRDHLSPAQYAQVSHAAREAGYLPKDGRPRPSSVDLTTYTEASDGSIGLSGGLLKDRADRRAADRITARGGENNLSDATRVAVRQRAEADEGAAVRRELVSAQRNLLARLQPEMSAHERNRKALEDVEKAMQGLAKVSKDASGKFLGLSSTVESAARLGIAAPGAGGTGFRVSSAIGDRLTAAREFAGNNRLTRLNARLAGYTQGAGFGIAAAGIGAAGSFASDALDRRAGDPELAARSDSGTGGYRANKGAAGLLQGAVIGAGVGLAGGPVGAAVGAVVGGAAGLYSALSDAAKDIRQAKINNALTELGDKLSAFATGLPSGENLAGIGRVLDVHDQESTERARKNASGFFGFDQEQFAAEQKASLRKEFGPYASPASQGLAKQAELLGREDPTADLSKPEVRAKALARLRAAGGGVNGRLIGRLSESGGGSVKDVEDRLVKSMVEAQRQRRVEVENKAARSAGEGQANTFGRLLQAVQSAADGLYGLQQRAGALADVLDGNVTASKVSAHAERLDEGLGRPDGGALKPLDIVAAAGGEYGGRLRDAGAGADAVARALPGVLAAVGGGKDLSEDNVTQRVSDGIYRNLGYKDAKDAPESVQKTVAGVLGGLNEAQSGGRGIGGVTDELRTDTSKFAEKLLSGAADPIKEFGGKIAKQLEDNANRLVDGLTAIHQRLQAVGQLYDQLGGLRTQNFRNDLQTAAENAGRGNQALDFASVADLEHGADQRQQRLAGVAGPQAFDPRYLGGELARVRAQAGEAAERQQAAFEKTGGKGPEFGAAAEELLRLKDRASNLQQALKHLADAGERNAVIQEKLNRLKQEEDGRLGLGERYLSADPAEQMRMNRGFTLANQASQAGNLDGFGAEDRRLIIDTLKGAGGATLTGFEGAPRADDLLKNLVSNSAGGAFQLTKDQKAEKAGLQGLAAGRGKTAEEAVAELIAHQEAGAAELYRNLQQQQTQFFSKLERLLVGMKRTDVENARARVAADKGVLDTKTGQRDALAGVGVTTTPQLEALRGKRGDVEALRAAIENEKAERSKIEAAKGRVGEYAVNTRGGPESELEGVLARTGLNKDQTDRVKARTRELLRSDAGIQEFRDIMGRTEEGSDEQNRQLDARGQRALRRALVEESAQDTGGAVRDARDKLKGVAGVDPQKIVETLKGPNADAFMKGLDAFDSVGNRIEDFGSKLADLTAQLAKLDEQLKALSPAPAGPVAAKAYGGGIFKPVGTDTVPAMLTPGEFVVNARSAGANAALLHRVNEARGPVYLAGGGGVKDYYDFQLYAASPGSRSAQGAAQQEALDRTRKAQAARRARDERNGLSARQEKFYAARGGRDAYEAAARQKATTDAAGDLVAAAQMRDFNRQAGVYDGVRRPGDEGQRNIANRVASVEDKQLEERFKTDAALQRYTAARVGRQMVTTAAGNVRRFATGGPVGGAGVGDTVPSLLTPGEFVLNTAAVARLGAHNVQRFNSGGPVGGVSYLAGGGQAQANNGSSGGGQVSLSGEAVKAMTDLSSTLAQFVQGAGGFGQAAQALAQTFNVFAGGAQQLAQALNNMPRSFTGQFEHRVSVVHNGAEVFGKLTPYIEQVVTEKVNATLGRAFKEHMPDAGVTIQ